MAEKAPTEAIFKMALISGITIFSLYMVYRFFQAQGWLLKAQTATREAEQVTIF